MRQSAQKKDKKRPQYVSLWEIANLNKAFTDIANLITGIASVVVTIIIFDLSQGIEQARIDREESEHKKAIAEKERVEQFEQKKLTIERLSVVDIRVSDLLRLLYEDSSYSFENSTDVEWINADFGRQNVVINILNEYEEICVGVKESIYHESLVRVMREYSLSYTFERYQPFIQSWQNQQKGTPGAWRTCLDLVGKWDDDPEGRL